MLIAIFCGSVNAQVKTCDLRINSYEFIMPGYIVHSLGEATAVATNLKTKKIRNSILVERTAFFRNIHEGTYDVIVSKKGYERARSRVTVNCDHVNLNNVFCAEINLVEGDGREIVYDRNRFTRTGRDTYDCSHPIPPAFGKAVRKTISGGVLNGKAAILPTPSYPPAARAARVSGAVRVQVLIDERGNVISAKALDGHTLLQGAAEKAALAAKFSPTQLEGQPVKVSGVITYNFVP